MGHHDPVTVDHESAMSDPFRCAFVLCIQKSTAGTYSFTRIEVEGLFVTCCVASQRFPVEPLGHECKSFCELCAEVRTIHPDQCIKPLGGRLKITPRET